MFSWVCYSFLYTFFFCAPQNMNGDRSNKGDIGKKQEHTRESTRRQRLWLSWAVVCCDQVMNGENFPFQHRFRGVGCSQNGNIEKLWLRGSSLFGGESRQSSWGLEINCQGLSTGARNQAAREMKLECRGSHHWEMKINFSPTARKNHFEYTFFSLVVAIRQDVRL